MGSRCVPKACDHLLPDSGPIDSGAPEAAAEGGTNDSSVDGPREGGSDAPSPDAHD